MKADINKQSNDYEIVDFVMDRFKLYTGLGHVGSKKKKKGIFIPNDPQDPAYIEGMGNLYKDL